MREKWRFLRICSPFLFFFRKPTKDVVWGMGQPEGVVQVPASGCYQVSSDHYIGWGVNSYKNKNHTFELGWASFLFLLLFSYSFTSSPSPLGFQGLLWSQARLLLCLARFLHSHACPPLPGWFYCFVDMANKSWLILILIHLSIASELKNYVCHRFIAIKVGIFCLMYGLATVSNDIAVK